MKLKRLLFILISIIFTFGLSSCSLFTGGVWSANDRNTAEDRFHQIMKTIEEKDAEGLKEMFSVNALKDADDIDGVIAYVMVFIKDDIISTDLALEVKESVDHGDKIVIIKCKAMLDAGNDYILFFTDVIEDAKNPDNVGLYMIQVLKEPYTKAEFDWGTEIKCAGIYRPDSEAIV